MSISSQYWLDMVIIDITTSYMQPIKYIGISNKSGEKKSHEIAKLIEKYINISSLYDILDVSYSNQHVSITIKKFSDLMYDFVGVITQNFNISDKTFRKTHCINIRTLEIIPRTSDINISKIDINQVVLSKSKDIYVSIEDFTKYTVKSMRHIFGRDVFLNIDRLATKKTINFNNINNATSKQFIIYSDIKDYTEYKYILDLDGIIIDIKKSDKNTWEQINNNVINIYYKETGDIEDLIREITINIINHD